MENKQGNRSKPRIEVDGIDADEVASLLEEVAKQIRSNNGGLAAMDKSASFKRVDTGQLYDMVHRS